MPSAISFTVGPGSPKLSVQLAGRANAIELAKLDAEHDRLCGAWTSGAIRLDAYCRWEAQLIQRIERIADGGAAADSP